MPIFPQKVSDGVLMRFGKHAARVGDTAESGNAARVLSVGRRSLLAAMLLVIAKMKRELKSFQVHSKAT